MITEKAKDDAGHEEVAITPEMVAAGVEVLINYEPSFDMPEDGATHIFRAMVRVSKVAPIKTP